MKSKPTPSNDPPKSSSGDDSQFLSVHRIYPPGLPTLSELLESKSKSPVENPPSYQSISLSPSPEEIGKALEKGVILEDSSAYEISAPALRKPSSMKPSLSERESAFQLFKERSSRHPRLMNYGEDHLKILFNRWNPTLRLP